MSAETAFYNERGEIVFIARGESRYVMFRQVKRDHMDEIHEAFHEHWIGESGEYEKDVRAWWAAVHPEGWIDTVEETPPPPTVAFLIEDSPARYMFSQAEFDRMKTKYPKGVIEELEERLYRGSQHLALEGKVIMTVTRFVWNGFQWEVK